MRRSALALLLLCTACAGTGSGPHTMLRASVVDPNIREEVAHYNSRETCVIVRGLYVQNPPGITQYYRCKPTQRLTAVTRQ